MNKKLNILITSATWKSALTCMRSLAKKGHSISLISSSLYTPSLYSKFCKEKIVSPNEKDKTVYLEFINKLVCSGKYDLLIPISDLCIEYFSEIREELVKNIKIVLPAKKCIDLARNKANTYRFAIENNIPIPRTYFPKSVSDVEKISKEIGFPCVVKEVNGTGGSGNSYINNKRDLISLFKESTPGNNWPVVQEFINGKFFGFTAVCNKGELLDYFMYEVLKQSPETGGITVIARSIHDERILALSKKLIEKLSWNGAIDLDIFQTAKGETILLEINPRLSGAIQFAYACKVDLPLKYMKLAFNDNGEVGAMQYKTGIYYQGIFTEWVNVCQKNKKNISTFLKNIILRRNHYDFSLLDPKLLFWQLKQAKWIFFS